MLPDSLFNWLIYRQSQWYSYRKHSWEKDCNMPIYVWNIVPILLHVRYFQEKINLHKTFIWKITRKTQFPFQPIFNNLKMAYFFLIFSILSISTSPRHPARHLWMSDLKRFQRQWCAKEIPIIITPTLYAMMDRLSFVDFAIYTWKWSKKFVDLWRVIPPLITFEINAHSTHPESVAHVCHLTRNLISPRAVYEPHSISTSSSNFTTSAAGNEDQRQQNWIQLQTYWYISLTICERRCFSSSIGNSEYNWNDKWNNWWERVNTSSIKDSSWVIGCTAPIVKLDYIARPKCLAHQVLEICARELSACFGLNKVVIDLSSATSTSAHNNTF